MLVVEKEIAAFSFGRLVYISQSDYKEHGQVILAHEKEHIRSGHFYDLFFLEIVKIIFWFNPFIYWLIRDLKEVHEFQADNHTLTTGIDATKYQLLIIQKSVGHQKFALANSFNHCQIKNRIAMINKLKTGKAWRWKVATFLPLLALLLIFCGRKVSSVPSDDAKIASINYCVDPKTKKYERLSQLLRVPFDQNKNISPPTVINIDIKKEGVYLKENLVTLDEFRKQLPLVVKNYPQSNILVNIIDKNNPDIQAIQNILKETGVAFGKPGENDRSSVASNLPTEQPRVLRQLKLIRPQTKVAASRAITLILDKDNSVYYYEGAPDKKTGIDPVVTKTDLKGIHRYLTKKNKDIISEVQQLRKKKEVFNLSENDFEKQRKEIISGKTALVVVVKSTNATQENISTILDEMERYQFYHYALFDVTDYDRSLMTNAKVELNPPAFSLKKQK